ncbi:MAG: tripartite tricarboxylate transporter substrate binding protein, partial [Nocardioidaceae bacterium]
VVPFAAGGGSDVAGRTLAKAIEAVETDLNVPVQNREGGSGAVGYAYFRSKAGDAETLLATETALLALPSGGNVDWTYKDFTPIMKVAEDFTLLVVPADAPYKTCTDVVDAAKSDRVVAGISGQYGLDNVVFSLVEQKTGAKLDRVSFESGGELIAALLGNQIDIASLNPGEVIGQIKSGDLKALCAFAPERYDYGELKDIPTAKEQGIDVSFAQFRGIIAPGGITDPQKQYWYGVMKKVLDTPEYDAYIKDNYLQPRTAVGDDFSAYLEQNKKLLDAAVGK